MFVYDKISKPNVAQEFVYESIAKPIVKVAAANCWNPLPNEVKNAESLASFRRQLKTDLFKQAFLI